MQLGPLHVLIIGGCAKEADHLPAQKDFVRQLTRRLAQTRRPVRVNFFPSVLVPAALGLLTHLPLTNYDLILLRPESPKGELPNWFTLRARLARALTALRPHRSRVVLLTPFPHRGLVAGWYRQLTGALWRRAARRAGYSVFDTGAVIKPRDEYFVTGNRTRLNAVSHELLAQELFDYCLAMPTVLATQSIKPPSEP